MLYILKSVSKYQIERKTVPTVLLVHLQPEKKIFFLKFANQIEAFSDIAINKTSIKKTKHKKTIRKLKMVT